MTRHVGGSTLKKQHTAAVKASGAAPFVLYTLRHTASPDGRSTWTLSLQILAGHTDMNTTRRYVQPSDADILEAMRRVQLSVVAKPLVVSVQAGLSAGVSYSFLSHPASPTSTSDGEYPKGSMDSSPDQSSATLTLLARWAAVGATLLAVFVALFKEWLQSLCWKPKFKVDVETRLPFCMKTGGIVYGTSISGSKTILWSGSIYYVRLWIRNIGNRRAEAVEVFVTGIERLNRDDTRVPVDGFVPSNLRWANTDPERPEIFYGMNPDMGRFCDLGAIVDPACITLRQIRGVPKGSATFDLVLQSALPDDAQRLSPGDYRITLKISAANAKPVQRTVKVSISGNWTEDQDIMFTKEVGASTSQRLQK
jgi:hypothetical protein